MQNSGVIMNGVILVEKYVDDNVQTYVPGLSTYLRYGNQFDVDKTYLKINGVAKNCYKPSQATNHYSIGVDCSGFVCASIYYDGAIYEASTIQEKKGTGSFNNNDNEV